MRVLILAGGGGHTGYAEILAQQLKDKAQLRFLVPRDDPLTANRLRMLGEVAGLTKARHPTTPPYAFIPRLAPALIEAFLRVSEADFAVSTGSNFCIPPSLVSWLRKIPLINIESADRFTRPSATAKILESFSTITVLQWEDQRSILPNGTVFGPFLPKRRIEPWDGGYVLIAAGTYGYEELLEAASQSGLSSVVLQTGLVDPQKYSRRHLSWRVFQTSDTFYKTIAGAEVVVAPPGATPLEAFTYSKPVVVVRYPPWSHAGTLEDAKLFASKLNAPLLSNITADALTQAVEQAKGRKRPGLKNGAKRLAQIILQRSE